MAATVGMKILVETLTSKQRDSQAGTSGRGRQAVAATTLFLCLCLCLCLCEVVLSDSLVFVCCFGEYPSCFLQRQSSVFMYCA